MKLKEMIKVMQHFANGREVEFSEDRFKTVLGETNNKDDGGLCWDWSTYDYRIKEPKQKVTIEKWLCQDKQGDYLIRETSNIDRYLTIKQIKLLEIYEVEL